MAHPVKRPAAALAAALVLLAAWPAPADEQPVAATYNGQPFSYQIHPVSQTDTHRLYRIAYPSPVATAIPQNNVVPGDYYVPLAAGPDKLKRPAVVCLHILHGNFELERITCSTLAAHGIPALMIKLPYYGERAPPGGRAALVKNPKMFLAALPQGIEDVRRAVDVLASRAEVNPAAIGAIGISLGGIVAATVAAEEPRIARAALILAGGDLATIIDHARETRQLSQFLRTLSPADQAQVQAALRRMDPLGAAAGLRQRARQGRVLMINASDDEVIPPECTRKLAQALGLADQVRWLPGLGHYTAIAALPDVLKSAVDFFALDLPPGARATPPSPGGPLAIAARLAGQAASLAVADPAEGRGHLVHVEADLTLAGAKPLHVRVQLARGHAGRFRLEATLPSIGPVALGQGEYPWMLAAGNVVFKGTGPSAPPVDARHSVKLRVLAGTLSAVAAAPRILETLVTLTDDSTPREKALLIKLNSGGPASGRLVLRPDGAPQRLAVDARNVRGEIRFRQWQIDTLVPDAVFLEPAGAQCHEVDRADLERMISAMFNLAMESM